jgi:glycerol uptake facilitator-like aquaporin
VNAAGRRLLAELAGTGLLVAVVVGSGTAATRLTSDGALRLLVSAVVTALGLAVLILIFAPAGGRTSTRWSRRPTGRWPGAPQAGTGRA